MSVRDQMRSDTPAAIHVVAGHEIGSGCPARPAEALLPPVEWERLGHEPSALTGRAEVGYSTSCRLR